MQKVYLKCDSRNIERAVERGDRRAINKRHVIKPVTTEQLGLSPTGDFCHIPQFRYPGSNEVGVMVPPPVIESFSLALMVKHFCLPCVSSALLL